VNTPVTGFRPARLLLVVLALAALFSVPAACASIDPIGAYATGDRITVTGSSGFPPGDKVWVKVNAADFQPTSKEESIAQLSGESKAGGTASITGGTRADGKNGWSVSFSTEGWTPGEYTVRAAEATGGDSPLWASGSFTLAPARAAGSVTPAATGSAAGVPAAPAVPTAKAASVIFVTLGALAGATGMVMLLRQQAGRD
jgi:hypothetical protein